MRAGVLDLHFSACGEIPDGAGDQDLRRASQGHDPGADVDGDPPELALNRLALAEMQAASDLQADLLHGRRDRHRCAHPVCGLGEGGEEPVAGRVFLVTSVAFELRADDLPEGAQELPPAPVAELGGDPRRVDDVQEEDGGEASA